MELEIDILSLFPSYFDSPFSVSMIKRAMENKLIDIRNIDIRSFSKDKHKKVDDRPFGGGPGMVLTPQPVFDAIESVKRKDSHVVYLSPQGNKLNASKCKALAKKKHLVLLCGHYEGVDQRAVDIVDEEISIGDYVLMSGCVGAIVLVESVCRFVKGVLGNEDAAKEDTFESSCFEGPQYTRPEVFMGKSVPEALKTGHHLEIKKFQAEEGLKKMKEVRPDLYFKYMLEKKLKEQKLVQK